MRILISMDTNEPDGALQDVCTVIQATCNARDIRCSISRTNKDLSPDKILKEWEVNEGWKYLYSGYNGANYLIPVKEARKLLHDIYNSKPL